MRRLLPLCLCFCIFVFPAASGPERPILVGDEIPLVIRGATRQEAAAALDKLASEKDILPGEIRQEEQNGEKVVVASFRSFSVGENTLQVGNTSVTVHVASSLEEEDKKLDEGIHLVRQDGAERKPAWGFPPLRWSVGILAFLAGLVALFRRMKKTPPPRNPFLYFEEEMARLPEVDWEYRISELLRELVDYRYGSRFLSGEYEAIGLVDQEDVEYISDLDNYKFSRKEGDFARYKAKALEKAWTLYRKLMQEGEKHV